MKADTLADSASLPVGIIANPGMVADNPLLIIGA
jgi:hypothetical protein